ncbi:hypothetical protein [Dactylosporangium fulvum]|uniref:Uncharacterized protein n=1 Tax=Dactylosporangium fulvum TaxID=53359 RepID=A0ABY5VNF9_9ACTN|nr:hypothetical protein [Dactylosporangium fulvum]UWP79252.1 hypothetical protein Dfulv_29275 [Dactylosporangium fulvum]
MLVDDGPLLRALRGEPVSGQRFRIAPPRTLVCTGQQLRDRDGRLLGAVVSMRSPLRPSRTRQHRPTASQRSSM